MTDTREKPIHTILLDTSPLLLSTPSISTLLAKSSALITTPSVISEVKDEEARLRIETQYMPFITLRTPKIGSVKFVKDFARKTGDAAVLSAVDFEVLALAYDLECERNCGDWRLRKVPGQKRLNGSPPQIVDRQNENMNGQHGDQEAEDLAHALKRTSIQIEPENTRGMNHVSEANGLLSTSGQQSHTSTGSSTNESNTGTTDHNLDQTNMAVNEISSDSDSEGWITPSNIRKHQANEDAVTNSTKSDIKTLQVATITGDFAMQNVLLQMNLNLLSSTSCKKISNIKQSILRCHGCFATTRDMTKQFCPRCGNPTLTRVVCTTNDRGEVKIHLKANMQWNNKGNVFSIPKPANSSSNQKWKGPRQGGGQNGWGNQLVLAEDQKEYIRSMSNTGRTAKKDLMDEDYLPGILTGERDRGGGRVKIGGGRNINARKR